MYTQAYHSTSFVYFDVKVTITLDAKLMPKKGKFCFLVAFRSRTIGNFTSNCKIINLGTKYNIKYQTLPKRRF